MRIIVMYDISMDDDNIAYYNKFRNELIKLGYSMIQYSIYVKCISAHTQYPYEKDKLIKIVPKKSNVRILLVTESQYQNIEIINGEKSLNEYYLDKKIYLEV
ncbi:CRISPR-associated endonuclease Cas2 [Mycoplasma sp. 332]|uniref:CRISPR-associated endonuclease Cas2 n=1 Tax=unclassified Asterococcus (in: mycoplasmas, genus) TaxID=3407551 RepID=UPI003F65EB53